MEKKFAERQMVERESQRETLSHRTISRTISFSCHNSNNPAHAPESDYSAPTPHISLRPRRRRRVSMRRMIQAFDRHAQLSVRKVWADEQLFKDIISRNSAIKGLKVTRSYVIHNVSNNQLSILPGWWNPATYGGEDDIHCEENVKNEFWLLFLRL